MSTLTPQEVLQALIDGKKLEYRWSANKNWIMFDPLNNGIIIECVFKGDYIFRLAQETITIGDVSFPKPVNEPLEEGTEYWVADPSYKNYTSQSANVWSGDDCDTRFLRKGLIHVLKENAIAHAKALVKLSGGNVDE